MRVNWVSAKLVMLLVGAAALLALVWFAWPRPTDTSVLQAYARLEQSPVPVRVVGWIQPSAASARLLSDGYVLELHAERLGDLTISGRRGAEAASAGAFVWSEGDVTYSLDTSAAHSIVQPRVVSLAMARQQLKGNPWDTPLLYAGYLPAFAIASACSAGCLLLRPSRR